MSLNNQSDNQSDNKLLNELLLYNDVLNIIKDNIKKINPNFFFINDYDNNDIEKIIAEDNLIGYYKFKNNIKEIIACGLLKEILFNSPKCNILLIIFKNIKTKLFPYQINNLNWMINIENKYLNNNKDEDNFNIKFKGGGLFDDVGLGKTLQIITLLNNNYSIYTSLLKDNKIFCKATLIIVPNHLCGQWLREINTHIINPINIINLLTKKHYNKYNYFDFIKADVVIVSANFFINCKLNQHQKINSLLIIKNIFKKDVNIFNIYWHRVVIDEFHEIEDTNLFKKLMYLKSDFRWIISATPFKQDWISDHKTLDKTSLSSIVDFLTFDINALNKINIYNIKNYNYIRDHFSKNTHNNIKELNLPIIIEEIIWLNFNDSERMIYNAYLADPNNNEYDCFLRQICCHPLISDKIRENISTKVDSLEEINIQIKKLHFSDYDKACLNYNNILERIEKNQIELLNMKNNNKTNQIGYKDIEEEVKKLQERLPELKSIMDVK